VDVHVSAAGFDIALECSLLVPVEHIAGRAQEDDGPESGQDRVREVTAIRRNQVVVRYGSGALVVLAAASGATTGAFLLPGTGGLSNWNPKERDMLAAAWRAPPASALRVKCDSPRVEIFR
jgi:hypothetical protein